MNPPTPAPAERPRPPVDPGDAGLMGRIALGDPDAARGFVERFQRPLLDAGCRILRDRGEAEDLCQEVFVQAFRAASAYRAEGSLRGWVFRIATNLALNRLRKPRLPLLGEPPARASAAGPDERLLEEEKAAAVREAVAALPEAQRVAVVLLRFEGLSYGEVAEALDLSPTAAASLIHRAHAALREKLRKWAK